MKLHGFVVLFSFFDYNLGICLNYQQGQNSKEVGYITAPLIDKALSLL